MGHSQERFEQTGGIPLDAGKQERQGPMQSVQNLEAVLNEGLRAALRKETPDQSLEVLLKYLGQALEGERTYIFERNPSGCDDNTYEWTASGVHPEKETLQNVPPEVCAGWYQQFRVGRNIVIQDLEAIRQKEPRLYGALKRQAIHSLVVVPLYDNGRILGFYGVDNPPAKSLDYASNMLQIAAHFIVASLRQRNLVRELQARSYDVLHVLNVDYVGIYQVDFHTGRCQVYREKEWMRDGLAVNFAQGYQTAMERYIAQYVEPRDQERVRAMTERRCVLARLRETKKFYVRYQVRDNPDGVKNVELHFSVTGKEGEEHQAIFAFRDANAVVEQEAQYRLEARRDIENVLEGARTGIWTMELEEGRAPRLYADRTMRMLLGVSKETSPEACYQSWFRNIDAGYVEAVQEAVREMGKTGRSEVVYPWKHPARGKIYVRFGGARDAKFEPPGVCLNGYHQDITETMVTRKKQDQAIMELLEKVRQANSAKSEFLSHMSHDLRTPIHGIQGMLAVMERSLENPEKQKECREKIRISAERLLALVNDVLEVSRLESGSAANREEAFDLRELLERCAASLRPKAEAAGVRLRLDKMELRHGRLIGSPPHLKRIFTNVLDNAVKYNRPDGAVSLQARETAFRNGFAEYLFTIADTGIGIGERFQPHIFEPFTQENQNARTFYSGAGLGMSIVKNLVDQLGGTIEVDSQVGRGSVFKITLSIQVDGKKQAEPPAPETSAPASVAGMRVLLVEDNEINCEIVQFILEEAGAAVVTAQNGQIAVETFAASAQEAFDCVLMDLMMPVMSGPEAARRIRGMDRPDAQSVPIIALSANAFAEDVAMAKGAGMNEHLAKPVDINQLFRTMCRFRKRASDGPA